MVGADNLRGNVVLIEAQVRPVQVEGPDGLARRQPPERGNRYLDRGAPPGLQGRGGIAEALHLLILGGQAHDRVVHQVDQPEPPVHPGRRKVADRKADLVRARLGPQPRDHGRGHVDPVHPDAALAERQCDTAGANAEFKGTAVSGQPGQEAHQRVDHLRPEQVHGIRVITSRYPLIEVHLRHEHTMPAGSRAPPPLLT